MIYVHKCVDWARRSATSGVGFTWIIAALPAAWEADAYWVCLVGRNGSLFFVISRNPIPNGQWKFGNRPVDILDDLAKLAVDTRNREDTLIEFISCHVILQKWNDFSNGTQSSWPSSGEDIAICLPSYPTCLFVPFLLVYRYSRVHVEISKTRGEIPTQDSILPVGACEGIRPLERRLGERAARWRIIWRFRGRK